MSEAAIRALAPLLGEPESAPAALPGGITNRNYVLRWAGRDCVLRLPGKETALLGIDRQAECAATRAAAAAGVGPEVIGFEPATGCLVTAFIPGRAVAATELRERVPEVARALRAVHAGPALGVAFDPWERIAAYRATALARGGSVPAGYAEAWEAAARVREALGGPGHAPVPCHNDLLAANFLDDGTRLRILDWEYAGMGSRYFDLANFSANNELSDGEEEVLLEAYFGEAAAPARLASLRLMKLMAGFWEAMWAVVQDAVSELEFDFRAYAAEHLDRVGAALADPRLRSWLDDARAG